MADRVNELENQLNDVRKDFADISETLKKLADEKGSEYQRRARRAYNKASNRAQDLWEDAASTGEDYYYRAKDQFSDGVDNLNDCVREKPLQSLAVVAGIGFLLGFLTRR